MRGAYHLLLAAAMAAVLPVAGQASESTPVTSARATASLVSEVDAVAPGHPFRVALRLHLAPGWHTYWRNPGDAGVAPDLSFTLPPGVTAGPVEWPAPERENDGPLTTFAYTGDVVLPVTITGATGATAIQMTASWPVCATICVPESGTFRLDLPAGTPTPSAQAALFAAADAKSPRPSPWAARIAPDGTLSVPGLVGVRAAWFAPDEPGLIAAAAPQRLVDDAGGLRLRLQHDPDFKPGGALSGVLTLTDAGGQASYLHVVATPAAAPPPPLPVAGLWRLLGLALLGGVLLNLMPCVFPVLAIKAVGLAGLAGGRRRQAALHAASYTAGVMVTFAALGGALLVARGAGMAAGWGFQFQAPGFVAAVAFVLFAVGLNLSGVYAIGSRFAAAGSTLAAREGHAGSFFTGLLAVVVATPCTAPFMGAAIAGALAAPPAAAIAVFLAMGLGLAAPYAALALIPGVARMMPRPGHWMEVLRQGLAFLMYGATVWLVWVMSQEAGPQGVLAVLVGLLLIGFGLWAMGLARGGRLGKAVAAASLLAALAVLPGIGAGAPAIGPAQAAADGAQAFSAARLAALRAAGRPVFVDATAAWCVTCLVNERVALSSARIHQAFAARGITYLRADWTRQQPEVSALLRGNGRDGVPLYLYYPPGNEQPAVLPQILTEGIVLNAIGAPQG